MHPHDLLVRIVLVVLFRVHLVLDLHFALDLLHLRDLLGISPG